jgi:hypothetical protein
MKNSVNQRRITKIDCAHGREQLWHIANTTPMLRRMDRIPQMMIIYTYPPFSIRAQYRSQATRRILAPPRHAAI